MMKYKNNGFLCQSKHVASGSGRKKMYLYQTFHFSRFTLHYSLKSVVPFEFKKFFVLSGNDVIKTILRNVDVGDIIFPPV